MFHPRAVTRTLLAVLATALPQVMNLNGRAFVAAGEQFSGHSNSEVACCSKCGSASCYGNCDGARLTLKEKIREIKGQHRERSRNKHRRERFLQLLSQLKNKKLQNREWSPFCAGHFGYFQTTWRPSVETPSSIAYPGSIASGSRMADTNRPLVNSVPPVPASAEYSQSEPVWSTDQASRPNQEPADFLDSVEGDSSSTEPAFEL